MSNTSRTAVAFYAIVVTCMCHCKTLYAMQLKSVSAWQLYSNAIKASTCYGMQHWQTSIRGTQRLTFMSPQVRLTISMTCDVAPVYLYCNSCSSAAVKAIDAIFLPSHQYSDLSI